MANEVSKSFTFFGSKNEYEDTFYLYVSPVTDSSGAIIKYNVQLWIRFADYNEMSVKIIYSYPYELTLSFGEWNTSLPTDLGNPIYCTLITDTSFNNKLNKDGSNSDSTTAKNILDKINSSGGQAGANFVDSDSLIGCVATSGGIVYARRTMDKLLNWIKVKLGITGSVGSATKPVYVDSSGLIKECNDFVLPSDLNSILIPKNADLNYYKFGPSGLGMWSDYRTRTLFGVWGNGGQIQNQPISNNNGEFVLICMMSRDSLTGYVWRTVQIYKRSNDQGSADIYVRSMFVNSNTGASSNGTWYKLATSDELSNYLKKDGTNAIQEGSKKILQVLNYNDDDEGSYLNDSDFILTDYILSDGSKHTFWRRVDRLKKRIFSWIGINTSSTASYNCLNKKGEWVDVASNNHGHGNINNSGEITSGTSTTTGLVVSEGDGIVVTSNSYGGRIYQSRAKFNGDDNYYFSGDGNFKSFDEAGLISKDPSTPTMLKVWYGTLSQYNNITTKDSNTEYHIYA
ncbi:MAG: hypothetical protein HUJ56_07520 [Erysipelotrichaceae bacterium]|nr:hypothetical protein [Erysipelotrichaceae bacterium]